MSTNVELGSCTENVKLKTDGRLLMIALALKPAIAGNKLARSFKLIEICAFPGTMMVAFVACNSNTIEEGSVGKRTTEPEVGKYCSINCVTLSGRVKLKKGRLMLKVCCKNVAKAVLLSNRVKFEDEDSNCSGRFKREGGMKETVSSMFKLVRRSGRCEVMVFNKYTDMSKLVFDGIASVTRGWCGTTKEDDEEEEAEQVAVEASGQ